MTRKSWLSVAMLVVGIALLAASCGGGGGGEEKAQTDTTTGARQGGTLRVNISDTDVRFLDPALAYDVNSWQIEYATCAQLLNYPDKNGPAGAQLVPEVAAAMPKVSKDGKTYTFTIRKGFRFSDGKPVTAASFAAAINRGLNPKMSSPAAQFVSDVVGADAVANKKATTASGVKVSGNTLTVTLTKVAPDFLSRIAMPFFCAIPTNLAIDPNGVNVLPGAGPYYIAKKIPNKQIVLKKNPHYGGDRPRNLDQIVFTPNTARASSLLEVKSGRADYDAGGLPPTAHADLAAQFGVNKGRYLVHPQLSINYYALNTTRPLLKDPKVRQAINLALDRRGITNQAGAYSGSVSDQILPPNMPGFKDGEIYPLEGVDLAKAKKLMGGRTGSAVMYTGNDEISQAQAQIVQANLKKIGINVKVRPFAFAVLIEKSGTRGEPFDIESIGWASDYPDPYDFINILLNGKSLSSANNVNTSYFNVPEYNRKMEQAALLSGDKRYDAYGDLDLDITENEAPLAVTANANVREFVSDRVGCLVNNPVYAQLDLSALCLKK